MGHALPKHRPVTLAAFADASYASDIQSPAEPARIHSRTASIVHISGAALWIFTCRQRTVALSACEAELTTLVSAARAILAFRAFVAQLFNLQTFTSSDIFADNLPVNGSHHDPMHTLHRRPDAPRPRLDRFRN